MKLKIFLVFFVFLVFLIFQIPRFFASKTLMIFCDVGEGDGAILVHRTTVFIIDAGRDSRMRKCLERHLPFWETQITGIILTHPDADHMNGIKSVIKRYSVKYLFSNFTPNKVGEYSQIYDALRDSGVSFKTFTAGSKIMVETLHATSLRNGIAISSFWPNEEHKESEKTNLFSNISVITIGESKFLMLADSEISTQVELLPQIKIQKPENPKIRSDSKFLIVKISHHGSAKNFSLTLMKELLPRYAVVSVGPNKYGHPGKRVIDGIDSLKIQILRTDKLGDIVFECEKKCELKK